MRLLPSGIDGISKWLNDTENIWLNIVITKVMKITFPLNFFKYLPIKSLVLYWICSWLGPWMGGCSSCSYDRGKKLSLYFSGYFVAYIPIFDIFPRTPWQFNIAIEHGHSYSWFCLLKMVMFNSYVSVDQRVYKSPHILMNIVGLQKGHNLRLRHFQNPYG